MRRRFERQVEVLIRASSAGGAILRGLGAERANVARVACGVDGWRLLMPMRLALRP